MTSDAISLIEQDHRALEQLFDKVLAGEGDRTALVEEIAALLTAHARAEEQDVYPAIKRADPAEGAEVEHAYDEHYEAEHLLRKARNLVASPHFEEAFTAFVNAVAHHVREEETEVLPALREAVDDAELQRLGEAFSSTRMEILSAPVNLEPIVVGDQISTIREAAAVHELLEAAVDEEAEAVDTEAVDTESDPDREDSGAQQPLDEATRDELYQLAKDADIRGRSGMTKQELAEALREGA